MTIINLKGKDFDKKIAKGITLVDFWATWCPPCRIQGPILDEVVDSIGDIATIAKVDVDQEQNLSRKFMIRSIPSLILFKDGQPVETMIGVQSKKVLIEKINKLTM